MNEYIFDDYDDQSRNELEGLEFLDFDAIASGLKGEDPFAGIRTNMVNSKTSFKEILFDTKYGSDVKKCGEYLNDFYEGAIDAKQLIDDLRTSRSKGTLFFYFDNYVKNLPEQPVIIAYNTIGPPTTIALKKPIPYDYLAFNGQKRTATLNIKLNKRACHVNTQKPGIIWNIKPKNDIFSVEIHFVYDDAISIRDFNITPEIDNDYRLEEKLNGITIDTKNIEDLLGLSKDLGIESYVYDRIKTDFKTFLISTKNIEELEFIYKYLPEQLLMDKEFLVSVGYETIYKHFESFFDYDSNGLLRGFKDNSNGVVKSLRCLTNFKERLLKDLLAKPAFIKQAYKNLDGSSEYLGIIENNRIIFADTLWSLCLLNGFKGLNRTGKTYKFGKSESLSYELDSNVWANGENNKLILRQITNDTQNPELGGTYLGIISIDDSYEINPDKGDYFHPLDLVIFEIHNNDEEPVRLLVPAIFVKALSDKKEWEEINRNIRIGVDVLAVLLGALTLGSTSGLWAVLATADIAIAGTDGLVMTFYDEIASSPGGKEFLQAWENIYLVGGAITAGPVLIRALVKGSEKLLKQINKLSPKALEHIRTIMLRVALEVNIHNFTSNTVRVLSTNQELIFATKGIVDEFKATKLLEVGCFVAEGTVQIGKTTQKEIAIIYKGTIIAKDTIGNKAFAKVLRALKHATPNKKKLLQLLEELEGKAITAGKRIVGYVEELFDAIDKNYKPKGFDFVDRKGIHKEYGLEIQTNFEGYSGYFRRNWDKAKKIFTFNHGFLEDLPKWVEDVKVPLVEGKGIPTQAYFTLRQMKELEIAKGAIEKVRMASIQNLETMGYIYQYMKQNKLTKLADVDILAAPSNGYMKTVMTQAGYELVKGKIIAKNAEQFTVRELKWHFNITKEYMDKYGLSYNSKLYMNFDIEVNVKYIK